MIIHPSVKKAGEDPSKRAGEAEEAGEAGGAGEK